MRLTDQSTTLRRLHPDDLRAFQAYRNDPAVAKFQTWQALDDTDARNALTYMSTVTPLIRPNHWAQIAVADTDTNALLGDMGWHLSEDSTEAELGITLAASAQGQGHATRAMTLAITHMFAQTPIMCIKVWSDVRNTRSQAMINRLGFDFSGFETTDGIREAVYVLHRPQSPSVA